MMTINKDHAHGVSNKKRCTVYFILQNYDLIVRHIAFRWFELGVPQKSTAKLQRPGGVDQRR